MIVHILLICPYFVHICPFLHQNLQFFTKNSNFLVKILIFWLKLVIFVSNFGIIPGDRAKLGRQPLRVCQNRVSYLHSLELWTLPRSWLLAVTELASLACRPAGGPVHGAYITFLKFAYFVRHTWLYKMSYLPLKIFWELWFPWSENSIWAKILEF